MQEAELIRKKYKNRKIYKPPPQEDNSSNFKKLIIVIIISFVFIAGEFIGGYISGSISVFSDAFHLVTDLIGFVVSFVFIWFSRKKPTEIMSFGYHRMELLGALGNLFIIWALAIFLVYQATMRIINRQFVKQPLVMLIVAAGGLPVNIIMYFVLHSGSSHSHGLMGEACGEQFDAEEDNSSICDEIMCEDVQCLINNEYLEHCHKQAMGDNTAQVHKHKNKVQVEGNKIIRLQPAQIQLQNVSQPHDHSNCNGHHDHDHNHGHEGHTHNHQHRSQSVENKVANTNVGQNSKGKAHQHNGKTCDHDHDHHDHDHDHHDHDHDHHGHDHSHGHNHESMSMKAAILHALSDIIQSIGLLISSLIIFFFGSHFGQEVYEWNNWHFFDPIGTYIFSVIVIVSTWPITKNCYHIIMQSTPEFYDSKQLAAEIASVQGVVDVHDLHIWDLRPGKTILIAHVFSRRGQERNVLKKLTDLSRRKKIYHSTFQVQQQDYRYNEGYILCDHDIH